MPTESIYFTKAEYGFLWDEARKTNQKIADVVKACVYKEFPQINRPKLKPAGASP